jgi:hypothetical protein
VVASRGRGLRDETSAPEFVCLVGQDGNALRSGMTFYTESQKARGHCRLELDQAKEIYAEAAFVDVCTGLFRCALRD